MELDSDSLTYTEATGGGHPIFVTIVADPHPDRRLRMFLGLPDPHSDPLVTSTDPARDPSIIKHK
jgi:hypothetical protein